MAKGGSGIEREQWAVIIGAIVLIFAGFLVGQNKPPDQAPAGSTYSTAPEGLSAIYEVLAPKKAARWQRPAARLSSAGVRFLVLWQPAEVSKADWQALESWVLQGGHLLVAGPLAQLPGALHNPAAGDAFPAAAAPALLGVSRVELGSGGFARVPSNAITLLRRPDQSAAVVSYASGKGLVTWSADAAWLSNGHVAAADNLAFALNLLAPAPGEVVYFDETVHGFGVPTHWWQLLRGPLQLFVLELAAALALLYWAYGARFGAPRPLPATPPRAAAEYVYSMAVLYRKARARGIVARNLYESLSRSLQRLAGGQPGLSHAAMAGRAAPVLGLPPARLQALLDRLDPARPARLSDAELIAAAREVAAMQRSAHYARPTP